MRGDRSGLDVFLAETARVIAENSGATPDEAVALVLAHEPAARALYLKGKNPRAIAAGIVRLVQRAEASKTPRSNLPVRSRALFHEDESDEAGEDEHDGEDDADED